MPRYRRKKSQGADSLIGPVIGLLLLGCFFVPGFGKTLLILATATVALAIIFALTRWWANRRTSTDATGITHVPTSLDDALKTAVNAGVSVERVHPGTHFSKEDYRQKEARTSSRYRAKSSLMTNAEKAFYEVLIQAVPEAPIFPKVRVADVIETDSNWGPAFWSISQKHFDWVLCDPNTFEPLVIIELDDSSHRLSEKQKRNDVTKNVAADEACIPLLRFNWSRSYDVETVRARIACVLNQKADEAEGVHPPKPDSPPPAAISPQDPAIIAKEVSAAIAESVRQRRANR